MIDTIERSYMGSGMAFVREIGSTDGLRPVGNATALKTTLAQSKTTLGDKANPGGGNSNVVFRISDGGIEIELRDFTAANLAMAFFGEATSIKAGSKTDFKAVAKKGCLIPLPHVAATNHSVTLEGDSNQLEKGVDYRPVAAGIYIPSDTEIDEDAKLNIGYDHGDQEFIHALRSTGKTYEFLFDGINEAQNGQPVILNAWRVRFGPASEVEWIGDRHASLKLKGDLLKDSSRGVGESAYYVAKQVAMS